MELDSSSYPRPAPFTWESCSPRRLLPIYPPPEPLNHPPLPSPPRQPAFDGPFKLSTHIFPATYLRTTRPVPVPTPPSTHLSKADRQSIAKEIALGLKKNRGSIQTDGYPELLWNCANRYVRKDLENRKGTRATLFLAHANGFPKEIWEPMMKSLFASPAGVYIDEVWSWESVQHGDAAILNAKSLAGLFDWSDNCRDILNFLLYFLPPAGSSKPLPTHLEKLPHEESEHRQKYGFHDRILIAVGHSYGGCTSALAALTYPKLFSSLVLVDPVIVMPKGDIEKEINDPNPVIAGLTLGAITRRDTWASREEALEIFKKSPFFGAWDPRVLETYVECGIYITHDDKGNRVAKLKMPPAQEAIIFSETHTEREVYQQLPNLADHIALRWVVPGKPDASEFGPPGSTQKRVWLRPKNSSNIRIPNAGHLIAQEAPQALAHDLCDTILRFFTPPESTTKPSL